MSAKPFGDSTDEGAWPVDERLDTCMYIIRPTKDSGGKPWPIFRDSAQNVIKRYIAFTVETEECPSD